jgi:release factor glutamine methyltransferase
VQVSEIERDALVAHLRAAGCVFAEDEAALLIETASRAGELDRMVAQRTAGLPLEQVLGWAEFCGLRVTVAPGVFVPRRRSGLLVRESIKVAPSHGLVLDLCCGSGAIGAVVAALRPDVSLHASDVEPVAVECARRNLASVGGQVYQGDLYAALPPELRGSIDLIVANAPYVPTAAIAQMPPEAREHEPASALDGGVDGLDLHRRIAADAKRWLRPGGSLLIETSLQQAPLTAQCMVDASLEPRVVRDEEIDGTVVIGQWQDRRNRPLTIT